MSAGSMRGWTSGASWWIGASHTRSRGRSARVPRTASSCNVGATSSSRSESARCFPPPTHPFKHVQRRAQVHAKVHLLRCEKNLRQVPETRSNQIVPWKIGGRANWQTNSFIFSEKNRQHFVPGPSMNEWRLTILKDRVYVCVCHFRGVGDSGWNGSRRWVAICAPL